jgi:hypothetical protein
VHATRLNKKKEKKRQKQKRSRRSRRRKREVDKRGRASIGMNHYLCKVLFGWRPSGDAVAEERDHFVPPHIIYRRTEEGGTERTSEEATERKRKMVKECATATGPKSE